MESDKKNNMEYRFLGNSGIKVSVFSFGNMVNHLAEKPQESTNEIVAKCLEYGINFFDTAESYGPSGDAETLLGQSFKDLNVRREDIVLTTKIYFGDKGFPNFSANGVGLSRKHIIEGTKKSLKRLQTDYVDVIFAHRYDYDTPLEEVIRAFSWLVDKGYAHYWGTSEWNPDEYSNAVQYARAHNLHPPVVEQPQYNMLVRDRFEKEYTPLYENFGTGTTVWSPLGQGVLSGRYNDGNIPEDSRFNSDPTFRDIIMGRFFAPDRKEKAIKALQGLAELAQSLGYTQAQLALAWVIANKDVSTCILGFSKVSYVEENLKALEIYKKWDKELESKIEALLGNAPAPVMNPRTFRPNPSRRQVGVFGKKQ